MRLIFIYGHAAAGKLTVARALAQQTGLPVFHNHLVVDAVNAVFPFGSPEYIRLREEWWLAMFEAALRSDRSLIFTFAPEPSVAPDFPERVRVRIAAGGGSVAFVALNVSRGEQEKRLLASSRAEFGKLRSLELLHALRPAFEASFAAMPVPDISIDTGATEPEEAARRITETLGLSS
jgi:chloramphenicol 3-O-phosphotransferase